MAPLQELLNLGERRPDESSGPDRGYWRWRCIEDMLTPAAFQWLHVLTKTSNRAFSESNTLADQERDDDRRHQVTDRAPGVEGARRPLRRDPQSAPAKTLRGRSDARRAHDRRGCRDLPRLL